MKGKLGQIGFVITKTNWMSRKIAWFLGSPYSHTFLVINETDTIETNTNEVHIDSLVDHTTNPDKACEVYEPIRLMETEKASIEHCASSLVGIKYGYLKFAYCAFQLLLRKIGIRVTMSVHGMLCDDVPAYAYINTNFNEVKDVRKDVEELRQALISSPNWRLVFKKE